MERISEEPDRPRVRASDAERDDALRSLAAHFADGRLDQPEFDRRSDAALAAVTRDQLRTLFADLPPGREAAVPERAARVRPAAPVLIAALFALAIIAVLHGAPPIPLIPLIFILGRRRRWNREARPWT